MQDFRKNALGQAAIGLSSDPINTQPDGTRQPVNPVLGNGITPLSPGLNADLTESGVTPLAGAGIRSGIVEAYGSRGPVGSSLSPGINMPSAAPSLLHRPAVLEIPRRRF